VQRVFEIGPAGALAVFSTGHSNVAELASDDPNVSMNAVNNALLCCHKNIEELI